MISTYDDYLPMPRSLSLEEMAALHRDMVDEIGNDCDSLELFEELVLKMQGKSAAWRDTLGYEDQDKYFRKRIGDFACYLVFVNSVLAR